MNLKQSMKLCDGKVSLKRWEDFFFEIPELNFESMIKNKCEEVLKTCFGSDNCLSTWLEYKEDKFHIIMGVDFDEHGGTYFKKSLFEFIEYDINNGMLKEWDEDSSGNVRANLVKGLRDLADRLEIK